MSSNEVHPDDWSNYKLLLQEYRTALDAAFPNVHKELTIAMGMGPDVTGVAPKAEIGALVDAVNMMTYDFNGAWDMLTSHNAREVHLADLLTDGSNLDGGSKVGMRLTVGRRAREAFSCSSYHFLSEKPGLLFSASSSSCKTHGENLDNPTKR